MPWISRIFAKTSALGVLLAAMGCASCFPALGSLAAAVGLGYLAQFEGMFINTLLPLFAVIALAANSVAFLSHRVWYRMVLGVSGPIMVLLTMYPLWKYNWSTYLLYAGIVLMLIVAMWDIFSPAKKQCAGH